jgi:hypothetical protein
MKIYDKDGKVLTNKEVIERAKNIGCAICVLRRYYYGTKKLKEKPESFETPYLSLKDYKKGDTIGSTANVLIKYGHDYIKVTIPVDDKPFRQIVHHKYFSGMSELKIYDYCVKERNISI